MMAKSMIIPTLLELVALFPANAGIRGHSRCGRVRMPAFAGMPGFRFR